MRPRRCKLLNVPIVKSSIFFTVGFFVSLFLTSALRNLTFAQYCDSEVMSGSLKQAGNGSEVFSGTSDGSKPTKENLTFMETIQEMIFPQKLYEDAKGGAVQQWGDLAEHVDTDSAQNFLFVGIMTARKFLNTRVKAGVRTWVPKVPGKVVYFVGEGEEYKGDLEVVVLKGIHENDYPPQKKSFAMISYINQHFAKHYKWVMRADDDVYVNVEKLVEFLKSIDGDKKLYLGQPGFGRPEDIGKLGLSGSFCMGGPGIIFSSPLLQAVANSLQECLTDTVTGHEDTELGRCVTITTGVQCTVNYQMKELFYQNTKEKDPGMSSFKYELGDMEKSAITLHSIKESSYVYKVHNAIAETNVKALLEKTKRIVEEIEGMENLIKDDSILSARKNSLFEFHKLSTERAFTTIKKKTTDPTRPEYRPSETAMDIFGNFPTVWDTLRSKTVYSIMFEASNLIALPIGYQRKKETQEYLLSELSARAPKVSTPLYLVHSYQRLRANRGAEALFFKKRWINKKREIGPILVRRPFIPGVVDFKEESFSTDNKTIHMLLTVFKRSAKYGHFLENYAKAVGNFKGSIILHVSIFKDDNGEEKLLLATTYSIMSKNPKLDIRIKIISEPWNKGRGIMHALADLPYTSLVLQMDVDMEFDATFLQRVVMNTVLGKTAYFPTVFANYDPETICYKMADCDELLQSHLNQVGLWKSYGLGMVGIYKRDLVKAGGFRVDIKGWGYEDVDFYEKCIQSGIGIIRSADPGITHRYHPRECNPALPEDQMIQCKGSAGDLLGSVRHLYWMLHRISNGTESS